MFAANTRLFGDTAFIAFQNGVHSNRNFSVNELLPAYNVTPDQDLPILGHEATSGADNAV